MEDSIIVIDDNSDDEVKSYEEQSLLPLSSMTILMLFSLLPLSSTILILLKQLVMQTKTVTKQRLTRGMLQSQKKANPVAKKPSSQKKANPCTIAMCVREEPQNHLVVHKSKHWLVPRWKVCDYSHLERILQTQASEDAFLCNKSWICKEETTVGPCKIN